MSINHKNQRHSIHGVIKHRDRKNKNIHTTTNTQTHTQNENNCRNKFVYLLYEKHRQLVQYTYKFMVNDWQFHHHVINYKCFDITILGLN